MKRPGFAHEPFVDLGAYRSWRNQADATDAASTAQMDEDARQAYLRETYSVEAASFTPPTCAQVHLGAWLIGCAPRLVLPLVAMAESSYYLEGGYIGLARARGACVAVRDALGWGKQAADSILKKLHDTGFIFIMPGRPDTRREGGLVWFGCQKDYAGGHTPQPVVSVPAHLYEATTHYWMFSRRQDRIERLKKMRDTLDKLMNKLDWPSTFWVHGVDLILEREE